MKKRKCDIAKSSVCTCIATREYGWAEYLDRPHWLCEPCYRVLKARKQREKEEEEEKEEYGL
jgi:hypothetical protein